MTERNSLAQRIGRLLDRSVMVVAALGLLAMMVHITADVLAGLLLNSPIALTSTYVIQYYMIAVAFLPVMAAEYRGAHISVDLFFNRLSPAARRWVGLLVLAVCLGVYLMLTAQSWQQAMAKFSTRAFVDENGAKVVVWPSFFMLPLAFGLSALVIAGRLARALTGAPPEDQDSEARDV